MIRAWEESQQTMPSKGLGRAHVSEDEAGEGKRPSTAWILRARLMDFAANQDAAGQSAHFRHIEDGAICIEHGKIKWIKDWAQVDHREGLAVLDRRPCLVMPGFVDTHMHYPQLSVMASHGKQLLDWLHNYTFPAESAFDKSEHCQRYAQLAIKELLRSGTTTAQVFATVHEVSAHEIFKGADGIGMCLISGKVMMDQGAPPNLLQDADACLAACERLIYAWHGRGRLRYSVTPRFALTSSRRQLEIAGGLLKKHQGLYLQSHIAENRDEVEAVCNAFPERTNYLDVYDHYGLITDKTTLAHGIYLSEGEWQRIAETSCNIAFCPTSNLFLGSGLFPLKTAQSHHAKLSLATDVGGGTSLSMLKTLKAAYKVGQLRGEPLDPVYGFYLAIKGGAEALGLQDEIGSLNPGCYADLIVIDWRSSPLLANRMAACNSIEDELFALMILGDERQIIDTYLKGQSVKDYLSS